MTAREPGRWSRRLMVPREHGAWGQLAVPVLCALTIVVRLPEAPGSSLAASLVASASLCAFVGHEPLLILLGHRGPRAQSDDGHRARVQLALLSLGAALLGALAFVHMPAEGRAALLLPALLALPLLVLMKRRQEKTLLGELLVAATLSSVTVPVMVAGGKRVEAGLALWVILLCGFAQATVVVRALMGRLGSWPARRALRLSAALVGVSLLVPMPLLVPGAPLLGAALLPVGLTTLAVALGAPHPRALRTVGWAIAAASVVSAALLVIAIR